MQVVAQGLRPSRTEWGGI